VNGAERRCWGVRFPCSAVLPGFSKFGELLREQRVFRDVFGLI